MAMKLSVYLDDNTYRKLGDIQRVLERDVLTPFNVSKAVCYAILKVWQAEFVEALNPASWSDEVRVAVKKYAPVNNGDVGGGQ